jgi:hypothetical protein
MIFVAAKLKRRVRTIRFPAMVNTPYLLVAAPRELVHVSLRKSRPDSNPWTPLRTAVFTSEGAVRLAQ